MEDFEDEDEDAHFCLKCHLTIIGLENYVNHRKQGCQNKGTKSQLIIDPNINVSTFKDPQNIVVPSSCKDINISKSLGSTNQSQSAESVNDKDSKNMKKNVPEEGTVALKADDFFSSLELQSSAKKAAGPSAAGKTFSGILTRSKTSAVIQQTQQVQQQQPVKQQPLKQQPLKQQPLKQPTLKQQALKQQALKQQTLKQQPQKQQSEKQLQEKQHNTNNDENSTFKLPGQHKSDEIRENTKAAFGEIAESQIESAEETNLEVLHFPEQSTCCFTPCAEENEKGYHSFSAVCNNFAEPGHSRIPAYSSKLQRDFAEQGTSKIHTYSSKLQRDFAEPGSSKISAYTSKLHREEEEYETEEESDDYAEYDEDEDDEEDEDEEDARPRCYGGKWRPSESGGKWRPNEAGGKWRPGEYGGKWKPGETGGKWKPGESGGKWKPSESGGKWKPGESGGKWRPGEAGGKWKPGEAGGKWKPSESGGKSVESGGKSVESGGKSIESGGKSIESGGKSVESREKSAESGGKWKPGETGGKWKPEESGGKWKPGETGGKWKPGETGAKCKPTESGGKLKLSEIAGGKWKPEEAGGKSKPLETGGKWKPEETGGKWKPLESGGKWKLIETGGKNKPAESACKWKPEESGVKPKPSELRQNELELAENWKLKDQQRKSSETGGKISPLEEIWKTEQSEEKIKLKSKYVKRNHKPTETMGGKIHKIHANDERKHNLRQIKRLVVEATKCRSKTSKFEGDDGNASSAEGQWKPQDTVQKIKCDDEETLSSEEIIHPPANYTGGKWNPKNSSTPIHHPPPTHTKGKWKPPQSTQKLKLQTTPFRKSSGNVVQYWCGPCNRRLASRTVYHRHLKSELHLRRTAAEEFEDSSSNLNTNRDKGVVGGSGDNAAAVRNAGKSADCRRRNRRRVYVRCVVCRARVTSRTMGKHLISHYHCRKGDISQPEARRMVLDNIHSIVLQSPYQCSACMFYCNTQENFLVHWTSQHHQETTHHNQGHFLCLFCKHSCETNEDMLLHLTSEEHNEVISVINRSVPIVIRQVNEVKCGSCQRSFGLNVALRKHCEESGHELVGTASDEYQNKQICASCGGVFNSLVALQRHKVKVHGEKLLYFCSVCAVQFSHSEEILQHRRSAEHRYKAMQKSKIETPRKCDYCSLIFQNFLLLKNHLKTTHPQHTHNCPHCAKKFTIPQELTVHLRSKSCTYLHPKKPNQCDQCLFSSDTASELLFHRSLHSEPQKITRAGRTQLNYMCPMCEKYFPRASLKCHLQNHLGEKNYECGFCGARFARKNNWKHHVKSHEGGERARRDRKKDGVKEKVFLCAVCGSSFNKNSILQKHMMIHNGKKFRCTVPDCYHAARTEAELRRHQVTHSSAKLFECHICKYRGKTKQQLKRHEMIHQEPKKFKCSKCDFTSRLSFHLKRHERVHSGTKPYACPHCEYRCNNLENLRKHVLSTNKHPGKCIYECRFCCGRFTTNFAREFRVHLVAEHGDVFQTGTEVAGFIAGIYDDDPTAKPATTTGNEEQEEEELGLEMVDIDEEQQEAQYGNKEQEELFPMYIIAKDEVVCVDKDTWSMVASFDVEQGASPMLVPFNEEGEEGSYFQERFE